MIDGCAVTNPDLEPESIGKNNVLSNECNDVPREQVLLLDLAILPPRQKVNSCMKGIMLPPLRAEEPVQSLRAALSEVVGFAHMTNFRFELEECDPTTIGFSRFENLAVTEIISPFTGVNATIKVPIQVKSLDPSIPRATDAAEVHALDEYGDLTSLLEKGLRDGSGFRIVLERYDAASVKDHVNRLRSLLDGNTPRVISLAEEKTIELGDETEEQEKIAKPLPSLPPYSGLSSKSGMADFGDFFYLACGEDPSITNPLKHSKDDGRVLKSKKKKGKGAEVVEVDCEKSLSELYRMKICRWNELEELTHIPCKINISEFHPPLPQRRLMGDIAYFTVNTANFLNAADPDASASENLSEIHITATTMGFYVNNTHVSEKKRVFDPSPAASSCFSHTLLDCLLMASNSFYDSWSAALDAAKEREALTNELNNGHFVSLFPTAIRGDFDGFKTAYSASRASRQALDASLITPTWLVPIPRAYVTNENSWNYHLWSNADFNRATEDVHCTFGVDLRNGAIRDWNEELQIAREMPTTTLPERIERARLIHKVLTEFGEASLLGVTAIVEGQIAPMNPNEATRSQVYLHNNIFFSRAVDAGPETFKIAKGDKAARKAANRDVQCIGTFHRMEGSGLFTLATVLIDHLGTRFVCQSILPGILIGEKAHTLLYGSVETGIPLRWNEDLHKLLEEKVGEGLMIATRPVYRMPLTNERLEEIKRLKKVSPFYAENERKIEEAQEGIDLNSVIMTCLPIEAKGIMGSDQRKYVLDFGRLTPRDANWIPKDEGGTGKLDVLKQQNGANGKGHRIPSTLKDDEWTMCVLRPELVTRFTQVSLARFIQDQKKTEKADAGTQSSKQASTEIEKQSSENQMLDPKNDEQVTKDEVKADVPVSTNEDKPNLEDEGDHESSKLSTDELNHLKSLRLNVNVFLPNIRTFEGTDDEATKQLKMDEQLVRDVAVFLWDDILPKITRAVRDGSVPQLPVDGKTLTEFLHRNGVNCRYLGQLASLAKEQEEADAKTEANLKKGHLTVLERRTMPKCWLELLECEIVARSAKHVLDNYLTENGGVASWQPAQTIASFLSALVSEGEESAAQTESRLEKRDPTYLDDDDIGALTFSAMGGGGDAVPQAIRGRSEVWNDIEAEVGRRFRYVLTLYNNKNKTGRALYVPLLRRFCQRSGIRLTARKYDVGGKCLCTAGNTYGGRLTASYPISPVDIVEVVPLMKHSAAYNEGFSPCSVGHALSLPSLQVSLQDARVTLERAHIQAGSRALGKGLNLAQEAAALYQRVTENASHPGVIESMELMATIFLEAGDPALAAANGEKALALTVQNSGFDSSGTFNSHMSLFQMRFAAREMDRAIKHLRAAIYILEVMAGPHHIEHFTAFHKLGSTYSHVDYDGKYLSSALEVFKEASKRESCDRLMEGIMAKTFAKVLGGLENYNDAVELEKTAFRTLAMFLGNEHQLTKESEQELKNYATLAIEKGNKVEENDKMKEEAEKAEAIAAVLAAEEEKKSQASKSKKKGKK